MANSDFYGCKCIDVHQTTDNDVVIVGHPTPTFWSWGL